jgi:hypothetical protein
MHLQRPLLARQRSLLHFSFKGDALDAGVLLVCGMEMPVRYDWSTTQENWEQLKILGDVLMSQAAHSLPPRSYTTTQRFIHPKVRFLAPSLHLLVSDEDGDGIFVVSDEISSVYGEGETDAEAVQDYLENLVSQFLYLEEHESQLAPGLLAELTSLRHHMMRAS